MEYAYQEQFLGIRQKQKVDPCLFVRLSVFNPVVFAWGRFQHVGFALDFEALALHGVHVKHAR